MLSPPPLSPSWSLETQSYAGANPTDQPLEASPYQPQRSCKPQAMVGQKSPGIAAVLSFLIVGLGQILKGLIMLAVAIVCGITIIGLIVSFLIWLYGVLRCVTSYN